jgi:UDP-2,3-diacylglucosamine pyrophosphatase LpxH
MPRVHAGRRASSFWTDDRLERAKGVLRESYTLSEATERLTAEWGELVTVASLQSAFFSRRADLGGTAQVFLGRLDSGPRGGVQRYGTKPTVAERASNAVLPVSPQAIRADAAGRGAAAPRIPDENALAVRFEGQSESNGQTDFGANQTRKIPAPPRVDAPVLLPPITRPEPLPPMSTGTARVRRSVERILFIPDVHVPFEDHRAWDLMMSVARAIRPEHIVILGDFADMWAVSAHDKSPSRRDNLESEMKAVAIRLDEVDALGAKNKLYCEGNHEFRLTRHVTQQAPELFEYVQYPKIQRLAERRWQWVPYHEHAKIGKVFVTHDLGEAGMYAASRARATMGGNVVIGHVHRAQINYASTAEGTGHVSAAFGWLGDAGQAKYLAAAKRAAWQLGFGLGYMEPASGHVHLQFVPIVDYRCVVEGALFGESQAA